MNLKRSLALALSLMLLVTAALPVAFGAGDDLDRLAGDNRWETAVEVSQEGWDNAEVVVLANGRNYPDALAGVSLAFDLDAPILLTEADSLVEEAKDEIVRLGANTVIILGGTGVISADVAEELEDMDLTVERISGADRFETAANVAMEVAPNGADTVVLASGRGYADALAAASYAAVEGYPILLTEKNSLPEATEEAIEELGATKIIVVGGTGVIAASAVADLSGVVRISGSNREATSVELAEYFAPNTNKFFVATGDGFADAITGAVLAAKEGTGILLVRKSFADVVGDFFSDATVTEVVIFGGTGVVSATVANGIWNNLVTGIGGIVGLNTNAEEVTIAGRTVEPDENGDFKVTGVAPGSYKAYFKAAGSETNAVDVVVVKDRLTVVEADAGSTLTAFGIQGVVVDKDGGFPLLADVALEIWDDEEDEWVDGTGTTAEASGIFNLTDGLEAGGKYRVTISLVDTALAEVYRTRVFNVTLPEDEGNKDLGMIEMVQVESMTISGVLKDAEGDVVDQDDVVTLTALGQTALADTNEDGEFEFADLTLPTGKYTLTVALGGDHAVYTATVSVTEGSDRTFNINLKYGFDVAFDLRSGTTDAADFTGAAVEIEELETDMVAGDPGEFSTTLAPGTYTLAVTGDYLTTTKYKVTVTDADISIAKQITPAGAIDVTVTDDAALVELIDADGKVVDSAETSVVDPETDDTVVFTGLPVDGEYTVRVSAEGKKTVHYDDEAEVVTVVVNTTTSFGSTVTLDAADDDGQVSGFIRKADGYPAYDVDATTGAEITYYYNDVENETKGDEAASANADLTGAYSLTALLPGTYDVVVSFAGHENSVGSMTIKAGDNKTLTNYRLVAGGNAKIELVVEADGSLVSESVLTLVDAYGETVVVPVAADGKFTIADLPAGTYTLTADDGSHAVLSEKIVVGKGDTIKVSYELADAATQHDITMWLVDEDYADITNAVVVVGTASIDTTGSASGNYEVSLANGTYTAEIYVAGYLFETVDFTVKDGNKMLPQIQLTPAE